MDVVVPPVEAAVEHRVAHERVVEAGVEQHPAPVELEQHAGHGLAQADRRIGAVDRDGLGQVLPAEGERDDPRDGELGHDVVASSVAAIDAGQV